MKIAIENLKNGEVLGEDVFNVNGTIIGEKDLVIDNAALRRLKIWGIKEIEIVKSVTEDNEQIAYYGHTLTGINEVMDKILIIAAKIKNQRLNLIEK